jgi:hypothetical protein
MTREEAKLLPVIQWDGREFLVDVDARRFRNVGDARDFIDMHSRSGREIVRQMQDAEWRVFAVGWGQPGTGSSTSSLPSSAPLCHNPLQRNAPDNVRRAGRSSLWAGQIW